jgi:hypothetical protein
MTPDHRPADPWLLGPAGRDPWPRAATALLAPALLLWTLPQTLAGLAYALVERLRGARLSLYRFGPFVFLVVRARPLASRGISLGLVVLADRPEILTHEFCHRPVADLALPARLRLGVSPPGPRPLLPRAPHRPLRATHPPRLAPLVSQSYG